MLVDNQPARFNKIRSGDFEKRELAILQRIKTYYSQKLGRPVQDEEAREIANNLLSFAKTIYGT
jgi:hypothetical protein